MRVGTGHAEARRKQLQEKDARIAELTTEVADLKSKLDFANAMNADQDKAVAELTAEVARYKADAERLDWAEANPNHESAPCYDESLQRWGFPYLTSGHGFGGGVGFRHFDSLREAIDIARNALKEGV